MGCKVGVTRFKRLKSSERRRRYRNSRELFLTRESAAFKRLDRRARPGRFRAPVLTPARADALAAGLGLRRVSKDTVQHFGLRWTKGSGGLATFCSALGNHAEELLALPLRERGVGHRGSF